MNVTDIAPETSADRLGTAPATPAQPFPSRATANYSLFVLTIVVLFTVLDRQVLALMIEPLKRDFQISDTQAALLIGAAFSLTYAIAGLPIARLADSRNRRNLVAICIAFWSLATMACGIAQNYTQVFIARLCVGIGEAGYGPATWSIVTDSYPREKVAFGTSTLAIGATIGTGLALFLGGSVLHFVEGLPPLVLPLGIIIRPWQWAFIVVGLPGLLWAMVVLTTREPARRGLIDGVKQTVPVAAVAKWMGGEWRAYVAVIGGICMKYLMSVGPVQWLPTMFYRQFGWTLAEIGLILGGITVIVSPVSMILGAKLSERWTRQGRSDANIRVMLYGLIAAVPVTALMPLMPTPTLILVAYAASIFISTIGIGPSIAAFQVITPNPMRAQVSSVAQFSTNVLAFAVGPLIVALFTDYLFRDASQLRYSMALSTALLGPLAIFCVWQGIRPYARAYDRACREFA
ncbi:MAG: MFS transporter [Tardiphaga sp.]